MQPSLGTAAIMSRDAAESLLATRIPAYINVGVRMLGASIMRQILCDRAGASSNLAPEPGNSVEKSEIYPPPFPVNPLGGNLSARREKFDAVLAYLVLEHVYDPRDFIAEAVKRLGPRSVLIVEVPDFLRDPVFRGHVALCAPASFSAVRRL